MNLIFSIMGLIGGLLCCTGDVLFQDLPGIIMPSLGLAMIGVIGIAAYII